MNDHKNDQEFTETKAKPVVEVAEAERPKAKAGVETVEKSKGSSSEEILDVANWTPIAAADRLALLKTAKSSARTEAEKAPNIWYLDDGLTPLSLYVYLKARFGEPNGFSMMLKDPAMGSDNLIHWHYSFLCGGRMIDIWGKNTQTEFYVDWTRKLEDADWKQIIESIKNDFRNYGPQLTAARQSLDKYTLFVNPHQRITKLVENYNQRLVDLAIEEKPLPPNPRNIAEMGTFNDRFEESIKNYSEAAALSTSLKILVPIWVESFINILIFILRKDELKNDDRVYQSVFRLQIDVRVKSLPLYCLEFIKPIDAERDEFKKFHSLMNERNNLLHGNVDPAQYSLGEVFFDGDSFIGKDQISFSERALKSQLMYVEPHSAIKDVETAKNFIEFVLEHIQPAYIDPIKRTLACAEPGWHDKNKHVAVLFPEHLAESFIGLPEAEVATAEPATVDTAKAELASAEVDADQ